MLSECTGATLDTSEQYSHVFIKFGENNYQIKLDSFDHKCWCIIPPDLHPGF